MFDIVGTHHLVYLERIENEMRWAMKKYQKLYLDRPLPHIMPHVFRHTFCTNMVNAGKAEKIRLKWNRVTTPITTPFAREFA